MTHLLHIGASAGSTVACYADKDWSALLAALENGDSKAAERIATSARPRMIPVANLKTVERPTLADAAAAFWTKRGKEPRAFASDRDGTPIVTVVRP